MCTSNNLKLNSRLSLSINHLDRMIGNPSGIGPSHPSIIINLVVTVVEFAEDEAKIRVEANHTVNICRHWEGNEKALLPSEGNFL